MTTYDALRHVPCVLWRWTSCTPDAPARARATLRCALDQLGFDEAAISDAVLAVSELVANAAEHAVGPYEMRLRRTAAEVICEVEDHDPQVPEIPAFPTGSPYLAAEKNRGGGLDALCSLLSERGRGLHIVHELTNGLWGFSNHRSTKTAWFAIPPNLYSMQHGADSAPGDNLEAVDSTE